MTECQYCRASMFSSLLRQHEGHCGARTGSCALCGQHIMLRDNARHFQLSHPAAAVVPVNMELDAYMAPVPRRDSGAGSDVDGTPAAAGGAASGGPWECPKCTFSNAAVTAECEVCSAQRPRPPRPLPLARTASSSGPWACPECSFSNAALMGRCEVCNALKPLASSSLRPSAPSAPQPCRNAVCRNAVATTTGASAALGLCTRCFDSFAAGSPDQDELVNTLSRRYAQQVTCQAPICSCCTQSLSILSRSPFAHHHSHSCTADVVTALVRTLTVRHHARAARRQASRRRQRHPLCPLL
jgi:hypothetical protein